MKLVSLYRTNLALHKTVKFNVNIIRLFIYLSCKAKYSPMKKSALNLFFILISICVSGQNSRKVLFIGIDGCRADALTTSATPAIDNLLINSIYSLNGLCAYKTWSGNGWSSMLTGVWHTKHGVTDNTFTGSNYINYPDFISRFHFAHGDISALGSNQ